ncbi:MAG: hypothetical protein K0U59_04890 [Gammaproteobacteria bacterium]|nr:hypothetical protein [Gammaproteobacteria bacterium]
MKQQQDFMDDIPFPVDTNSGRLIPQLRIMMRSQNKAWATERTYVSWITRLSGCASNAVTLSNIAC